MLDRRRFVALSSASALSSMGAPNIVRAQARLAQPLRQGHRSVRGRRRDRHHRAHHRQPAVGGLGPAGRDREPRRRRRQHRHGRGRPVRARWLHDAAELCRPGDQPLSLSVAVLRSGRRLRAGLADLPAAEHHGGAEFVAGEIGEGLHRLCQGQPGQDHLRLGRHRHLGASVRRIVQAHGRHRDAACALSRRGPGDAGRGRGPARRDFRQSHRRACRRCRAAARAGSR